MRNRYETGSSNSRTPRERSRRQSAVTLYVAIVGLGIVLLKVVELQRLSFEIEEIVRRKLNEYYAR